MGSAIAPPWAPPVALRPWASVEFRAMASPCRIVADSDELASEGRRFVESMERRWSRFVASSEISDLNRASGQVCVLPPDTYRLVELAQAARHETGGAFNPLVLDRLEHLGYAVHDSATGDSRVGGQGAVDLGAAPLTTEAIELYPEISAVRLPSGSRFDPGGIGKGLIGDLVADHLVSLGAATTQIELGGDVRLVGSHWTEQAWSVNVRSPHERERAVARLTMPAGAIATSSVLGRTWRRGGSEMHHLIDAGTGLPSSTDVVAVTVVADRLWWAEIVAKVAVMAGSCRAEATLRSHGVTGVVVHHDGTTTVVGPSTAATGRAA